MSSDVTYWRNPETGLIEGLRPDGSVVTAQNSLDKPFDSQALGFKEHVRPNGDVIHVREDTDVKQVSSWQYSPMLGGLIAAEIAQGARITTLWKRNKWCPPYAILARWMANNEEFKTMIDRAVKDRAQVHFEEIIETADDVYEQFKDDDDQGVAAAKLRIDARKFLAEKGDSDTYGTKSKQTVTGNVQIVIDTGIRRDPALRDVSPLRKIANADSKD